MTHQYNDGLLSAGRRPRLYLAKAGEVVKFEGANIPAWCAIVTAQYVKAGKWSNTSYELALAPGVRPLHFVSPMHGTWGDDLTSWGDVAETLGLPVEVAQRIVRAEYRSTAARLDTLETFAMAVEAKNHAGETVIVSFGAPSNRARLDGYWESPKSSETSDGHTVTVAPKKGESGADWSQPVAVEPEGATIISSRHSPGMYGGYWTIEVAVPTSGPITTRSEP